MKANDKIKEVVKNKYSEIAKVSNLSSCCGPSSCCQSDPSADFTTFQDSYEDLEGYIKEADLGLGCGLPTEFADIKKGDTVVDLGSGAGNDVFVARSITGETGRVIGIDFTEEMIKKAELNNQKLGYSNIDFKLGDIEKLPLEDFFADVIVSNCVLNLVPDKRKAFSEIHRVLKPTGHFCVSDIVIKGELPDRIRKSAEMYTGCVAGALELESYVSLIENIGFKNIKIHKTKTINIPVEVLMKYLNKEEFENYFESGSRIVSLTISGEK